ncbi:MAG TPA: Uma2 family endonuclease [Gammaproteobacteria bacterium]
MAALADRLLPAGSAREDHYVHLHGATWADYERLLVIRDESAVPRITYLEGTLEIMSPSLPHESIKSTIGRLVEVWCLEHGVEFSAAGSWTIKDKREEAGAEPDECYIFGPVGNRERPELAIEVVWTHGGLDKLGVYRRLGVPEVWYFRDGRIEVHVLRGTRYEQTERSEALPGIDLEQLASFLDRETTSRAIRDYRAALANDRRTPR